MFDFSLGMPPILERLGRSSDRIKSTVRFFWWNGFDCGPAWNMASIEVSDRVVVDIKVVNDQGRAEEVLRNLWSYRHLETLHLQGCALTDEDIAGVEHVNRRVKYLCLRGNNLCNPWRALSTKFPELLVFDCRGNRYVNLPRRKVRPDNEAEEVPVTLCEVKHLLVDVERLVARNGGISRVEGSARELCPKISRLNYSDVNIEDEGIGEGRQEEGAEDDGEAEVESEGGRGSEDGDDDATTMDTDTDDEDRLS